MKARQKVWDASKILVGLAASAGFGWLAARGLDWSTVRGAFEDTSYGLVFAAVVVFLIASYIRAHRWQILFVNEKISTSRLFIIQNEGIGLNNIVPVRVASEAAQLAVLTLRDRIDGAKALATLGMERVIDVIASTLILAIAFFLVPEMENFKLYVWGAVGFAVAAILLVRFVAWGGEGIAWIRRISFLAAFSSAIKDLEKERGRLVASLLLSILYWLMVGVTAWMIAAAVQLPISPMTATLVIMGTIFFATAVPAAPSAIGTFEFAMVYVLTFFGVEREAGFGFAIITHAVFFLPPTIIAAIFLPREGIISFRGIRSIASRVASVGNS